MKFRVDSDFGTPEARFALFLCFFTKMFLLRFKKVDFLKSAHGTTWGGGGRAGGGGWGGRGVGGGPQMALKT